MSRKSVVGMGLSSRLDDPKFESQHGQEIFLQNVDTGCGAHHASYSFGMGGSFFRGKAAGADPGVALY